MTGLWDNLLDAFQQKYFCPVHTSYMLTIYTPTGHLAQLRISDRENMNDTRYGVDAAQRAEIMKCYDMAHSGLASAAKYIRKQVARYPDNPIFLNYLGKWHDLRGDQDQAIALLEQTYARFPDYLFASVSMATTRISQDRADEALLYLGANLRIEERFSGREEFHINEVEAYEMACIKYLIVKGELDNAQERLTALRSVCDNTEWLNKIEAGITMGLVAKRHTKDQEELKRMPRMEFAEQPMSPHADRELVLHHPQLQVLFERSMDLSAQELREILALPTDSLLQDLHAIVQSSIDRFHHYQENEEEYWYDQLSFVHHALHLLGELQSPKSLESVLLVLSQSREYLDFYLGDWLTEDVWEPLAKLADGRLARLDAFMRTPRLHAFSKVVVSEAVNQLGQHRPELLPQVEQWYAGLLEFYGSASPDEEVMDAMQLGLMVGDLLDLDLRAQLPAIEALYARGIVPTGVSGTIEEVRKEFGRDRSGRYKRAMLGIEERYAALAEIEQREPEGNEDEWEEMDDGLEDVPLVRLPITRAAPKIGRNDPCPCGSGKKYKKCCEGKMQTTPVAMPGSR